MSDSGKAVFLSYASQDAEAARRIAEALRAAGVEVWFDQSELVGGDAWDAKIRKQIAECALFVPVISANTQARLEGYFRLEWKIAAQRTHTMADERVFLLPVVIDDTRDTEARVPAEFKGVQWTRLRPAGYGGQARPDDGGVEKFCHRVKKLLEAEGVAETALAPHSDSAPAAGSRKRAWIGYGWAAVGIVFALVYAVRPMFQEPRSKRDRPAAEPAPVSEARRLTHQARELIIKTGRGSSKWEAAALLCERALALDPTDAEAHALASQVDSRLWFHVFDRTPKRSESARSRAARALDLAPASFESRLAQATFLVLVAGRPQSEQAESVLRQLRLEAPTDPRPLNLLGSLFMAMQRNEESLALNDEEARLPGNEAFGLSQKAWNLHRLRRIAEMETALDRSIELQPFAGSVTLRVYYDLGWWGDGDRALASLSRLPAEELAEDNGISAAVRVHRWRRDPEALLRFLGTVPREWIWWGIRGPKTALTGDAHASAGRMLAARTDWQSALAQVERRLAEAPNDQNLFEWKAYLHARLGDLAAARDAYQRSLEFVSVERGLLEIEKLGYIAPEDEVLGELERRAENTVADLEAKRRMSARFISAADLRLNPAWDPVRAHPRFQALLAGLDADPRFNPNAKPAASPAAEADEKSVAVLAFANLSDDKANEYFSDGISEELLNVLAKVPGLTVRGRSSGFYFKGKQMKSAEIGQQLDVAYLVQGSVRRAGDRVRISAQLIRAATDEVVWSSGSLDRDVKDIFAVQDEIAALIAKNLSVSMGVMARAPHQVNPDALTALLEGRQFWLLRTMEGFARAGVLFRRAVELDPDWAPAHAALANLMTIEASYRRGGGEPVGERFALAAQEAKRAIELDPSLGEPRAALGKIAMENLRLAEAGEEFRRALALEPNNALVRDWYGDLLVTQGRLDLAIVEYRRAADIEPLSPYILWDLAWELMHVRRYGESLALIERAIALTPNGAPRLTIRRARLLLELGRQAEAVAALRPFLDGFRADSDPQIANEMIWCLQRLGLTPDRERWTAELLRQSPGSFSSGVILLMRGEEDRAYPLLEKCPPIFWQQIYWDPVFDPVRETPRFRQMLEKLGCAAEYQVARATLARLLKEASVAK